MPAENKDTEGVTRDPVEATRVRKLVMAQIRRESPAIATFIGNAITDVYEVAIIDTWNLLLQAHPGLPEAERVEATATYVALRAGTVAIKHGR